MDVVTRFAPSPTGYLHIGGVRTALFCWLYARRHGGRFILRIEDTDTARSTQEAKDAIIEGMNWVGLDWDEGPHFQMDSLERYRQIADELVDSGQAYRCYCTPDELDQMRAEQMGRGENPRYDGRCRHIAKPRVDVDSVVRFVNPESGSVIVDDIVRGRVVFENSELGDMVILRSNGIPTYHFGVVVDDEASGVTHVIRGDDHLNNTPRHINLINALGYRVPKFAHVPMILGEDGAKMSKRHGAVSVLEYRDAGFLPDAVVNYLVRLGWSHGDQEVFSRDEMVELFDLADINASASRFSDDKLRWLNQQYIIASDASELGPLLEQQLQLMGLKAEAGPPVSSVVEAFSERAVTIADMATSAAYLYRDFSEFEPKAARKHLRPVAGPLLRSVRDGLAQTETWSREAIHGVLQSAAEANEVKFGKVGQPVRVAVTYGGVSPPIDLTVQLVGRDRSLARLDTALEFVAAREAAASD